MKTAQNTQMTKKMLMIATLTIAMARVAVAAELTAFELIKEGNRYIGEQSKDKVVQIRSEKSVGTLVPTIWYIVYYDPDATFKSTEVKFGAGQKLKVTRPLRVLEPVTGDNKLLNRSKLKVDSDKAIQSAGADPLVKPLTLKATQLWLKHGDEGPVWKVKLWAAKLQHPNKMADIGDIYISTEDGKIVRRNLHINSVD